MTVNARAASGISDQRNRLLDGVIEACARRSYDKSTVADVLAISGVSRKTFYEQFNNKEACFVAAYERGVADLQQEIASAVISAATWQSRLRALCSTYTEHLAARPAFAQVFAVEVLTAGPEVRRRRDLVLEGFVDLYRELYRQAKIDWPDLPELDPLAVTAALGGVTELTRLAVTEHGPEGLLDITDVLVSIAWAAIKGFEDLPEGELPKLG